MIDITHQQAANIIHATDEDRARKALVALLDFAAHTAIYADDTTLQQVLGAIEALQSYIGFPMPAGVALRHFARLSDVGWQPNSDEWPDHAEI
jgi:hypothetical protein